MVKSISQRMQEMNPRSKQELKRIKDAKNSFQNDAIRSIFYFTGKCFSSVGGIYAGFNAVNDLSEGKYFSASMKVAIAAGCYELYRIFNRNSEEVERRMKKTEAYLEDKMREEYGK